MKYLQSKAHLSISAGLECCTECIALLQQTVQSDFAALGHVSKMLQRKRKFAGLRSWPVSEKGCAVKPANGEFSGHVTVVPAEVALVAFVNSSQGDRRCAYKNGRTSAAPE